MRKLLIFSTAMAAACLVGLALPAGLPFRLGLCLLALALLALLLPRRPLRLLIGCFGLCFGFLYLALFAALFYQPSQNLAGQSIRLDARVVQYPVETEFGVSILVRGGEAGGRAFPMRLYLDKKYSELRPGDRIRAVAYVESTAYRNGRQNLSLIAKRIFLSAKLYGKVELERPARMPLRYLPARLGESMRQGIDRLYDGDHAALLKALLTGEQSELTDDMRAAFSRSGLSHVVAVSGMHISFLAGILGVLLPFRNKRTVLLQIALIFFFALMTGSGPGALRAAFLCTSMLLAPLFGRQSDAKTSLFAALFLLLLLNPYAIAGAGLQFSFAATLGIYLVGQPLCSRMLAALARRLRGVARAPISILGISLGAMLFTTPLTALYFGQVSLIAPLSNLLTNAAVALGFLLGLLSLLGLWIFAPLGTLLAGATAPILQYFLACAHATAALPFASLPIESFYYQALLLLLYTLILLWLLASRRSRLRPVFPLCGMVSGLCCAVLLTHHSVAQKPLVITALDVGQGQSLAISSDNYYALVDCGGTRSPGHTAADYLQSLGLTRFHLMVLTHYHEDHAAGLAALFSRLTPDRLILPDSDAQSEERRAVEALALAYDIPVTYLSTELQIPFGRAELRLLPPAAETSDNEAGLALLASLGNWDALITGDMSTQGEARLLQSFALPDLELLVLGHHGSRYASSELLLDTLRPELALASVAAGNSYGHPAPETLARLAAISCTLFRTDIQGSIQILVPSPAQE